MRYAGHNQVTIRWNWNGKLWQEKLNRSDITWTARTDREIFCQFSKLNVPKTLYLKVVGIFAFTLFEKIQNWTTSHSASENLKLSDGLSAPRCQWTTSRRNLENTDDSEYIKFWLIMNLKWFFRFFRFHRPFFRIIWKSLLSACTQMCCACL